MFVRESIPSWCHYFWPPMLNKRSTGALESKLVLCFENKALMCGYAPKEATSRGLSFRNMSSSELRLVWLSVSLHAKQRSCHHRHNCRLNSCGLTAGLWYCSFPSLPQAVSPCISASPSTHRRRNNSNFQQWPKLRSKYCPKSSSLPVSSAAMRASAYFRSFWACVSHSTWTSK